MVAAFGLNSCNLNESKEVKNDTQKEVSANPTDNAISTEDIDKTRSEIESLQIAPVELSTESLREKIKQKWSKIHVYVQNGNVVKIKTYPYAGISKRTEEFYANKDGLLLVVIEDNGEETNDKENNEIDKYI